MPPVASYGVTTSPRGVGFATVVLVLRQMLADATGIDTSRVIVVADRARLPKPRVPAEKHLRVRPLGRTSMDNPGAGRLCDRKKRVVAVDVITRSMADQQNSDLFALTDETEGHLALEDSVLDALDLRTPASADNVPYSFEPIRETSTDDPNRPQPGDGFTASTIYFEVGYIPPYLLSRV